MKGNGSLKQYREEKGLTQTKLAGKLGISQQTLSSWERQMTTPKPYQMQKLEEILGISKEKLFYDEFHNGGGN